MASLIILIILIIIHFIFSAISRRVGQHTVESNRFVVSWGNTTSLLVTHFRTSEVSSNGYSDAIIIKAFGGFLGIAFGKRFAEENRHKHYGFKSTRGELIYNEFWWGSKSYDSPFNITSVLIAEKYLDKNNPTRMKVDADESPCPFKVLKDTTYVTKDNFEQHIHEIEFYLLERSWTSRFFKTLKLSNLFFKRKVSLVFFSREGLGMTQEISGLIQLHKETIDAYDNLILHSSEENLQNLEELIDERIAYFMLLDKNF